MAGVGKCRWSLKIGLENKGHRETEHPAGPGDSATALTVRWEAVQKGGCSARWQLVFGPLCSPYIPSGRKYEAMSSHFAPILEDSEAWSIHYKTFSQVNTETKSFSPSQRGLLFWHSKEKWERDSRQGLLPTNHEKEQISKRDSQEQQAWCE